MVKRTIYRDMIAGSLWGVAMRWSTRGIGLVSVVILARILTPADFGIMAMFSLFAGLIEGFAEMGTGMLLLRQAEITRADCDTAWTLRIIQGVLIGAALLICAPLAVRYFSEPRLFPVIVVMALCSFIGATANIGATLVRKELDFAKDFRYGVYGKLVTFFPTLALAFMLRNYWALVAGNVAGTVAGVALSYRMHPYRPRLSLERARQYLSFSISVIGANIARFLKGKVDVLVIGGSTNAALTGSYNVASELATLATQEIVIPVWRGLFPAHRRAHTPRHRGRDRGVGPAGRGAERLRNLRGARAPCAGGSDRARSGEHPSAGRAARNGHGALLVARRANISGGNGNAAKLVMDGLMGVPLPPR